MLTGVNNGSLHSNVLRTDNAISRSAQRIASGKNIIQTSDDPAGSSTLSALESKARNITQLMSSQQNQASLLQTASASLSETSGILQRLHKLSIQGANGSLSNSDRGKIQQEFNQLSNQIDTNINQTQYNGRTLLDGSFSTILENNRPFSIESMTAQALGLDNLSVITPKEALLAQDVSQSALNKVSSTLSSIGSILSGITSSLTNLQNQYLNVTSAKSQIEDVNMAKEIMNLTLSQMQSRATIQVYGMNEESRSKVINLLSE